MVGLDRALEARRDGLFAPGQVVDIRYQDIRHDLIGAVARIYDEIGLELTAEAEARMRAFLAAHPGDQARQPQALLVRRDRARRGRAPRAGRGRTRSSSTWSPSRWAERVNRRPGRACN